MSPVLIAIAFLEIIWLNKGGSQPGFGISYCQDLLIQILALTLANIIYFRVATIEVTSTPTPLLVSSEKPALE